MTRKTAFSLQAIFFRFTSCWAILAFLPVGLVSEAAESDANEKPVREIYVPAEDFDALLENQPNRVLLEREEYEDLLAKAEKDPASPAPVDAALLSSEYRMTVAGQRAMIEADLILEVIEDSWATLPLTFSHVAIQDARLDGDRALLWREKTIPSPPTPHQQQAPEPPSQGEASPEKEYTLFLRGKGRHRLKLKLIAPLQTGTARQELAFRLPSAGQSRMRLTMPGDVEMKSGASVIRREVVNEGDRTQTRFDLIPPSGAARLVMTLNSHRKREQKTVLARSVQIDEVTSTYERLHVTLSLEVLHQAIDRFRVAVPKDFEVTEVHHPQLSHWRVSEQTSSDASENDASTAEAESSSAKVLEIHFREAVSDQVLLKISAVKDFLSRQDRGDGALAAELEAWEFPSLVPLDVSGNALVTGLLLDERLRMAQVEAVDLIPIDVEVLASAIPESVFQVAPGAPTLNVTAAWYAPGDDFRVGAEFQRPKAKMEVTTNLVLELTEQAQKAQGVFVIRPAVEKVFAFDFLVPEHWMVTKITNEEDLPLSYQFYPAGSEQKASGIGGRMHVRLPQGVETEQSFRLLFEAVGSTPGWLTDWKQTSFPLPAFTAVSATRDTGAVAVVGSEDFVLSAEDVVRLTPMGESEKREYLSGITTDLAFRYQGGNYRATLLIERTRPRITARVFSFYQIQPSALEVRYEILYTIEEASTRHLAFELPADTPTSMTMTGLSGTRIKEYYSNEVETESGSKRRWEVLLADRARDQQHLAVEFQLPVSEVRIDRPVTLALPPIVADGVAWQSGLASVEGHKELDVRVHASENLRPVDVGELAMAQYLPGRRLLGVYSILHKGDPLSVTITRNPGYPLYPTIVQSADIEAQLSNDGKALFHSIFRLRSRATFLKVFLLNGARLWSAELDGKPLKPQRDENSLLIDIPSGQPSELRELSLVYASQAKHTSNSRMLYLPHLAIPSRPSNESLQARKLSEGGDWIQVPIGETTWRIIPPPGHRILHAGTDHGSLDIGRPPLAIIEAGKAAAVLLLPPWGLAPGPDAVTDDVGSQPAPTQSALLDGESAVGEPPVTEAPMGGESPPMRSEVELKEALEGVDSASIPFEGHDPMAFTRDLEDLKRRELKDADKAKAEEEDATEISGMRPTQPSSLDDQRRSSQRAADPVRGKRLDSVANVGIEMQSYPHQAEEGPDPAVEVRLIGSNDFLNVMVEEKQQINSLMWSIFSATVLIGLLLGSRSGKVRFFFVLTILVLGTLLPLIPTLDHFVHHFNMGVYGALVLIPVYFLLWVFRCFRRAQRPPSASTQHPSFAQTTGTLLLAVATASLFTSATALGQSSQPRPVEPDEMQRILVELVNEKLSPLSVPEEAILIPYDLGENETVAADPKQPHQKILVPYDRYVDLWNLTHPDDKLETDQPTPVPYALGGAAYEGTLAIEDSLHLEGTIAVELLRDRKQLVPIRIEGGVLTSAKLDGKPAEMSVAEMATPVPRGNGMNRGPNAPPAPQAQPQASAPVRQMEQQAALPNPSDQEATLYLLAVEGKGRHVLDLSLRMHVERQGGWRIVSGRLPQAPATSVKLVAPEENLEFRAENNLDPLKWTSEQAGRSLETVPGEEGGIRWQWRPRVSEGEVDRSLTVQSEVFFDVQEDGLAVDWDLDLNFRGGRYDQFRLRLPEDYLVASIEGANVRGWETVEQSDSEARGVLVDVELLQPSTSGESFTVSLWKTRRIDTGDRAKVAVPVVSVVEAAIHRGRITIRHSPLLTLQTIRTAGVSRTERNDSESPTDRSTQQVTQSPLGVSAVQGYLFHSEGYGLELEVSTIPVRQNARLESVMKISEFERRLETRLLLDVHHRPIFQLEIFLPEGFHLDRLSAPGDYQWAITEHEDRRLLTIYLANGQIGRVPILMEGKLDQGKPENPIPLPSFEMPTLEKDVFLSQEIAVQVDPAFEVSARNLENCRTILLERLHWLKPSQRSLTRFGIESTSREFEGVLSLSPRKAEVRSDTITNVRLTRRAVEETILIDFTITRAGIQEVEFLLPPWMADSLIEAPLLKHKTVTPVDADDPQSPLEVRLELQDEVMNQLRVLVRHDRLLIPEREYRASVPTVKTGSVIRQYIVFENAGGRDEMIIDPDSLGDVEALQRQQNAWSRIASLLGAGANEVYLVKDQAKQPELRFRTHQRKAIEMAGARIGLAETRLVMDHNGAWRAEQIYRIDNKTEQNLEIILPEHGGEQQPVRLWTAQLLTAQEWELRRQGRSITGRPVKPSIVPVDDSKSDSSHADEPKPQEEYVRKRREAMEDHRLVLIPLLKTEVGDLDYIVRLVYGGKGVPLRSLGKIEFPFLETLNIPVESSVVKLQLPEDFDFSFDGTMRLVDRNEASDLRTAYSKKTSQRLVQTLRTGTAFEKARALNSLNIFNSILSSKRSTGQALRKFGSSVSNLGESEVSLPESEELAALEDVPVSPPPAIENESRIISEYRRQSNARSRNVAVQTEGNFDLGQVQQAAERVKSKKSQFDSKWFMSKQLANSETVMPEKSDNLQSGRDRATEADMALSVETSDEEKAQIQKKGARVQSLARKSKLNKPGADKQVTDQLFLGKVAEGQQQQRGLKQQTSKTSRSRGESAVQLYQQKHLMQNALIPQSRPTNAPADREARVEQEGAGKAVRQNEKAPSEPSFPPSGNMGMAARSDISDDDASDIDGDFLRTKVYDLPTHFASLDADIPDAGKTYLLTSPQGKVEIEAIGWSRDTLARLTIAFSVVLLVVLLMLALYFVRRWKCSPSCRRFRNKPTAFVLVILGIVAMGVCSFGVGLILVVAGLSLAAVIYDRKSCEK